MAYKPYKLLNRSEILYIENAIKASFNRWSQIWYDQVEEYEIICRPADALDGQPILHEPVWLIAQIDKDNWVAATSPVASLGQFATGFFASQNQHAKLVESKPSALMNELAISALNDLLKQFSAQEVSLEQGRQQRWLPNAECIIKGSGAAVAELNFSAGQFVLIFSADQVASMLSGMKKTEQSKLESLAKVNDLLSNERLPLRVLVGEVQLELGLLQTITIGDVIKLDASINQPLDVVNAEGIRLCGAYLGTCNGMKSVQLTK